MDVDDGSPLPDPPSPQVTSEATVKVGPQPSKQKPVTSTERPLCKAKKKVGRPSKQFAVGKKQGMSAASEAAASLPTSILLMAGTSSRGRKIVRKEDINFVTN